MPTWLVYVLSFLVVLGVLIFVHELGHFLAAKAVGIHVFRFSLGIGRPIRWLTLRRGDTEYCVSWLPFGGYVKMAGLEEEGPAAELEGGKLDRRSVSVPPERTFDHKPLPARLLVIVAGVTMNYLFAFGVYSALAGTLGQAVERNTRVDSVVVELLPAGAAALATLERGDRITAVGGRSVETWGELQEAFLGGGDSLVIEREGKPSLTVPIRRTAIEQRGKMIDALIPYWPAAVSAVVAGGPAARAGIVSGDTVLAVDGDTVLSWSHMASKIRPRAGDTLELRLQRDGQVRVVRVVPEARLLSEPGDTAAAGTGAIGIRPLVTIERVRYGALEAVRVGAAETIVRTEMVLFFLKGLVLGQVSPRQLGGPVLIGQISGQVAQLGLESLLGFMAFLSVNLAVLNLLPIPVLDGGHVVFLLIEAVRRRPLAPEVRARLTQAGMVVLIVIMVFALGNDLMRILGR